MLRIFSKELLDAKQIVILTSQFKRSKYLNNQNIKLSIQNAQLHQLSEIVKNNILKPLKIKSLQAPFPNSQPNYGPSSIFLLSMVPTSRFSVTKPVSKMLTRPSLGPSSSLLTLLKTSWRCVSILYSSSFPKIMRSHLMSNLLSMSTLGGYPNI